MYTHPLDQSSIYALQGLTCNYWADSNHRPTVMEGVARRFTEEIREWLNHYEPLFY